MYRLNIGAFTTTPATTEAIKEAMGDILLVRSSLEVYGGGILAATARFRSAGEETPDLLIVESDGSAENLRGELAALSEFVSEGTRVILIGSVDRIDFYREMMEEGIGEYLISPVTVPGFMRAVRTVYGSEGSADRGRVISVFGAKGGVGSSTISHNLSWCIAKQFARPVSLVDMDLHFGTVGVNYNNESRNGLRDALMQCAQGSMIDESFIERLFTKVNPDVWLLASNPSLSDASQFFQPEPVQQVLETVAKMATFIVLDLPHVWTSAVGAAIDMSEEIIIVSDASLSGLRNTQMLYEGISASKPQGTFLRYVVNGFGQSPAHEVSIKDFTETLGAPPMASIPWNPAAFRAAAEAGQMLPQEKKNAKITALFEHMARSVSNRPEPISAARKASGGFLSGLFGRGKGDK